jgi:hypothetical protein
LVNLKEIENACLEHSGLAAKGKSVSAAIVDAFLSEYKERAGTLLVDS